MSPRHLRSALLLGSAAILVAILLLANAPGAGRAPRVEEAEAPPASPRPRPPLFLPSGAAPPAAEAPLLPADDLSPGPEALRQEIVFAGPTPRTPRFFDPNPDPAYEGVDPADLLRTLPGYARAHGRNVDGILIVGPAGFLYRYDIVVFLLEADAVRVNHVVIPHGRITSKATGSIPLARYHEVIESLTDALPEWGHEPRDEDDLAFAIRLAYNFTAGPALYLRGKQDEVVDDSSLEVVNSVLGELEATYGGRR